MTQALFTAFLGVDENRIEMLFVDDASRGTGISA
jgi:hypothetical protein